MAKPNSPIAYRLDINGLRAYAVLAVLLFHFKIAGFGAGFLGVDIFFVISGFLMTAIVSKGLGKQNFSLIKFYMARIRRIVPVLMALLVALLILGWFWLPTPDYKTLGEQSAYALSFISNIYFGRAAGYFDTAAHEKWLLHTWTLGVEFQFYILLPIYLLILNKIKAGTRTLFYGLLFAFVASIASVALSIFVFGRQLPAVFYLLPTRGWEFVAGGLVFLAKNEFPKLARFSKAYFVAGFALLALSMLIISSDNTWPSGWTLMPVLATALIILSQQERSVLIAHPIFQWLGDRSYSIYLWHWPVIVALYFIGIQKEPLWIAMGILLSVLFGHLSYWLVETPTRQSLVKISLPKQIAMLASLSLLVGLSTLFVMKSNSNRLLNPAANIAANEAFNKNNQVKNDCKYRAYNNSIAKCIIGPNINLILIGDSHSEMIASSLEIALAKRKKGFLYLGPAHGCATLRGFDHNGKRSDCLKYFNLVNSLIEQQPKAIPLVIYTNDWSWLFDNIKDYENAIEKTVCPFIESGRDVYIARPAPSMEVNVPNAIARNIVFNRPVAEVAIKKSTYKDKVHDIWLAQDAVAEKCGVKILDPTPFLCDAKYCYGSKNGRPLYYDNGHLSEYGNKFLVPMFEEIFKTRSTHQPE